MAILSDKEICKLLNDKKLIIENFSEKCLTPASYDLRLGEYYYSSSKKEPQILSCGDVITIEPNQFVLVTTYEILQLPRNIVGQIGLRARYSLSGLLNISGIQVDPGFKGRLVLGIANLSAKTRKISYLESIFTIQFQTLLEESERQYSGFLLNVNGIPSRLVELLGGNDIPTICDLGKRVEKLESNIKSLTWVLGIVGTIILTVLTIILDVLVSK